MFAPWKKNYDQPSQLVSSVAQSCLTLCNSMDCSTPGLPVHPRQLMKKQRHCLASKGPCSQSYGFSSSHVWTIKKAEHRRIDAFELWCWRGLLRVPWTARRSNQPILKEISLEYSLEGLMLKLKLQYFGHLSWLIWKDPDSGKDWRREEKGMTEDEMVGWHHRLNGHEFE